MRRIFFIILIMSSSIYNLFSSQDNTFLTLKPFDIRNTIGGKVILSPRIIIEENDERKVSKKKLKYLKIEIDNEIILETTNEPFYVERDFTYYSNGNYTIKVFAKDEDNFEYQSETNFYVSNVTILFRAKLNNPLPENMNVYLTGNISELKPVGEEWNPKGKKLTKINDTTFETELIVGLYENFTYELTLGGWALKARDEKDNVIHKTVKITPKINIIEEYINNWGKLKGEIKECGYIITFTNFLIDLFITYTHPFTNDMTILHSYDNKNYIPIYTTSTQFSKFRIPSIPGRTLYFTFAPFTNTNTFKIPDLNIPYELVWFSDVHIDNVKAIQQILKYENPSFIIYGGDFTKNGRNNWEWDTVHNIFRPLFKKHFFLSTPGNHEECTPLYNAITGLPPNYSFQWLNAFFISLDINLGFEKNSDIEKWLINELKKSQNFDFRIIFFHIPPYSSRKHGSNTELINNLVPILEKNNFHLVLSGHDHGYEASYQILKNKRTEKGGIVYVVSGIGGYNNLYESLTRPHWSRIEKKIQNYLKIKIDQDKLYIEAKDDGSQVYLSYSNFKQNANINTFLKSLSNDFNIIISNTNYIFYELNSWLFNTNFIDSIKLFKQKLDKNKQNTLIQNIDNIILNIETLSNINEINTKKIEILTNIYPRILQVNQGPNIFDIIEIHKNDVIYKGK